MQKYSLLPFFFISNWPHWPIENKHSVSQLDHMDLIKALIVFGADLEIRNNLGETPGLIAARISKGQRSNIEFLI